MCSCSASVYLNFIHVVVVGVCSCSAVVHLCICAVKVKPVAGDELFHPELEFLHVHHGGVELDGEGLVVVGGEGEEEGRPDGLHSLAFLQLDGQEVRIDNWNRWKRFSCRV